MCTSLRGLVELKGNSCHRATFGAISRIGAIYDRAQESQEVFMGQRELHNLGRGNILDALEPTFYI
jgi:hypothetical protein